MTQSISPKEYAALHGIRQTVSVAVDETKSGNKQKAVDYYRAALALSEQKRGVNDGVSIDIRQDLAHLLYTLNPRSPEARDLTTKVLISAEEEFAQSLKPQGHGDDRFRARLWAIVKQELNRWYERARVAHEARELVDATADFKILKRRLALLWKDLGEPTGSKEISDFIASIQSDVESALKLCEKETIRQKLKNQIEYFFRSSSLQQDSYLRKSMNGQGWVLLFRIASFRSVYSISQSIDLIRQACERSDILEVKVGDELVDRVRLKENPERWVMPEKERRRDMPDWKLRQFGRAIQEGETSCAEFQNWEAKERQAHREKMAERAENAGSGASVPMIVNQGESPGNIRIGGRLEPGANGQGSGHAESRPHSEGRQPDAHSSSLAVPPDPLGPLRRKSDGDLRRNQAGIPRQRPQARLFDTTDQGDGSGKPEPWFSDHLEPQTQALLTKELRQEHNFHRAGCKFWTKRGCKCDEVKSRRRVRIAILDTGIDLSSQALTEKDKERIKATYSPCPEQFPGDQDTSGHGTHLTMLLRRVAPAADIYVARVCASDNDFSEDNIVSGIRQAVEEWNVDIISMSFGFSQHTEKLIKTLERIHDVLLFAAASNDGVNTKVGITYPARLDNVFAIFATDQFGKPSGFNPASTEGNRFCTLGEEVVSLHLDGKYRALSGTSIASPIAAATAALILEFTRQKRLDGQSEIQWLERLEQFPIRAMRSIFDKMGNCTAIGNYKYIAPWLWLDIEAYDGDLVRARNEVSREISQALRFV